jgi:hypothetical protein
MRVEHLKPRRGSLGRHWGAGLVTIGKGDNLLWGGKDRVEWGSGFNFPIVNTTVTGEDKTIVRWEEILPVSDCRRHEGNHPEKPLHRSRVTIRRLWLMTRIG